jgi:hypothetical protein
MNRSSYNSKYIQGIFKPLHPDKFIGNLSNAKYRSSWELAMCQYLDNSDFILKWGIEQPIITYQLLDGSVHRYYPDFVYVICKNNDANEYERVIVEVKPKKELQPPQHPKNETFKALQNYEYNVKTYQKNLLKWNAALDFAEKNKYKFIILTEETLKQRGILKS